MYDKKAYLSLLVPMIEFLLDAVKTIVSELEDTPTTPQQLALQAFGARPAGAACAGFFCANHGTSRQEREVVEC